MKVDSRCCPWVFAQVFGDCEIPGGTGYMCNSRGRFFRRKSCRHSCHRPDIEWALSLCTTNVVDYHQEDLFDTLANNSVDVVLRRCGLCLEKPLVKLGCCLSAETHARMVMAMEAREGPTTQDRAEDVVAVSRLLFEGTIATCYQVAL